MGGQRFGQRLFAILFQFFLGFVDKAGNATFRNRQGPKLYDRCAFMSDNAGMEPAIADESRRADRGFGDRVRTAMLWRSGSQIASQAIMWGSTLAVIRILNPSDYGLFAMSQVIMVFLSFLNGYGFASALVQQEAVDRHQVRQAFGILLLLNAALALVQIAAAPYIARYYGQPLVTDMLRVQAIIYLATPLMVVPEVLMSRTLDFRRQAYVNLGAALAGGGTALTMALMGFGVWTLVVAPIALFWTRAIGLCIAARFFVLPSFDFRGTGRLVGFGGALLLSHLFWIIQSQADIFIAGRQFDPHALGLYAEALFLAQIFASKFVPPLNEVAFPAYSRLQGDSSALRWSFLKAVRLILLIACPIYLGMAVTAEPLVATLFGEKWLEMVPLVQILALAMPFMTLQILFAPALNALGAPRITVFCSAFGAVLMPIAFLIGVQFGATGLAWAWFIALPLLTAFTVQAAHRVIGISWLDLMRAVLPVALPAILMAGFVAGLDRSVFAAASDDLPSAALRLAILVAVGGLSYLTLLKIIAPSALGEIIRMARRAEPAVTASASS